MGAGLGKIVKKDFEYRNEVSSQDDKNYNYNRFVFTDCRNVKSEGIWIMISPRSPDWQIGFFNTDEKVYFDKIVIEKYGKFSSVVRNYWWNGKKGEGKKEGYYSLIQSVKKLKIYEKHAKDLLDYVEGKYKVGGHWQINELGRNIELRIEYGVEETTLKRLSKYFDSIQYNGIIANLKTENNMTCDCDWYKFENCKGVIPERLIINATVEKIDFDDAVNEIHIPEIVMEEKAGLKSIIHNKYGDDKYYSILPHVKTLVIRNNPKVLYDLVNYINGRYKIYYKRYYGWKLHKLNKNMKTVIEKPGITFCAVKVISDYFTDVLVDHNNPEEYLSRQQLYQKSFQKHFDKYDLETDQIGNLIPASQELRLENGKFNIRDSNKQINKLQIDQKIASQQFICFHDTDEPVVIDRIVIKNNGDLRCVLQNAYYNGMDAGFFSLLQTAKELEISNNHDGDNQVLADLTDYIEGKYALNTNWKQEELDKDMRIAIDITIDNGGYSQSLSIARRLRKYFRNVSIDRIYTLLQTENIINQEYEDQFIFIDSREANPKKLVINAQLVGDETLILFNQADGEVHIPEITIDEQGCFAAIVQNKWQNNKKGNEEKYGYYSLVQYVETLTIKNNPGVLKDFADYMIGKYEIENNNCKHHWKVQQLSKDIKVVVEGPGDAFLLILRISRYFQSVTINEKQANDYIIEQKEWNDPDYKTFRACFGVHGLLVEPPQCGVEFQKVLKFVDCVYNIRKSVCSIDSLTVKQKLDINQFVCFYDIDKPVAVDKVVIDDVGDLRSVLQNAYYNNGQGGFFSLLGTAKKLNIHNNEQTTRDLADYVDGKYTLHPKWETEALDKDIEVKINIINSLDVAKRLRNYFKNISINYIWTSLKTENVIDQQSEKQYIFNNCRNVNPQKLVINAKLTGCNDLIKFYNTDGEVCIPEITINEHGSFDTIIYNYWRNSKSSNERKSGYYSLVSHIETLNIQNNREVIRDLDKYVSRNYKIKNDKWKVQKVSKNILVRINGVKDLDEQINRLKNYFGYIVINGRKALRNKRREAIANIKLGGDKIQQQSTANADRRNAVVRADAEIAETRRRIENARARLRRRRARFQEYLALAE